MADINERYLGDESARLRFLREARAAAKVRHSNVASVLHLGRTGNSYFYAIQSCFLLLKFRVIWSAAHSRWSHPSWRCDRKLDAN